MTTEQNRACYRNYPEIYYKIQPYIMMACDEVDAYDDYVMPTQDMVDQMTGRIYEDVCKMYPECREYSQYQEMSYEAAAAYNMLGNVEYQQYWRGGLFNDLITIMFLNELYGRRRWRRRYW